MDLHAFERSLQAPEPPVALPPLLRALWWDSKGDWERAHTLAQEVGGREGAWVHAYLHRREGDRTNAGYWYRQAGRPAPGGSLDEERREIVSALLGDVPPAATV